MFHDLDFPPERRLDPLVETFLLVSAIGPDQLQTRKDLFERREQVFAAAVVLDVGFLPCVLCFGNPLNRFKVNIVGALQVERRWVLLVLA